MVLSRLLLDSNLYLSVTRQLHWAPRPPNRTRCSPNCSCLSTRRSRHFLSLQRIKTIMNELYLRRDFFALTSTSVCPSLSLFLNLSLHRHVFSVCFILQLNFYCKLILQFWKRNKNACLQVPTYLPTLFETISMRWQLFCIFYSQAMSGHTLCQLLASANFSNGHACCPSPRSIQ